MYQQNQLMFNQTHSMPTIMPYTFTTGELDSLRGKLQMAEQQMSLTHSKNAQSIIQFSWNEISSLQRMIDMTYLQGLSGSGVLPSIPQNMTSSMNMKSGNNTTLPSNYICHKCGIQGHFVQDCPNVIGKGPPPDNYVCHKCNIQGHWIQECPLGNQQENSKPPPPGYCCHRCGVPGHWIKHCPTNNSSQTDQRDIDSLGYDQRDNKISSSQESNTQHVSILTNTNTYLVNNTTDTDQTQPNTINVTTTQDT